MQFKTLDPDLIRLLTKDDEDILTSRAAKRNFAVSVAPCPQCGGEMRPSLNPVHAFTPDEPLPRIIAECAECSFAYDPNNGIVVGMGRMIIPPSEG